ncbi:hypothetical protein CP985_13470 [Malaciobacter mytili LMG 24559]|uniref:Site-specific tyrosine recombinase, phage integrase family n=1 Tax=Malaciobacter mytili LMG 24559 TaxID=1032238 RepID=A0AAX2ACY5_9BACT|nr:site-specific integrase [Malaciobacter mytili]AXH16494.1 site-specific tyrosine recombinase, phage integrase family [Malaciobacter mytili LMG 24559]RXK12999.1 hypothetical protein CP985_13470 [Malaciobacter mytili LMG 24559]
MSISIYSMKISKLSIIDTNNNAHLFNIDEKVSLRESEIKFTKTLYPYVVLFDSNMELIKEANDYLLTKLSRGQEINTALSKGYDLKHFYTFLKIEELSFADIKPLHINDFIAYLMYPDYKKQQSLKVTSKRTGKTINRIVSTVRDFYRHLEYYYGLDNPFEHEAIAIKMPMNQREGLFAHLGRGQITKSIFKVKESSKNIKVLTHHEFETLNEYFKNERDRLIFKFMFFTGARIGEALSLKIQDIKTMNSSKKVQTIELSKPLENESHRRRLKTGTRKLYVPNKIYYELNNYYDGKWSDIWDETEFEHDYFFISESKANLGSPISYATIYKKFKEAKEATGIDFTPHDLRHTFATNLARNKVDITTIQSLLGHKNPSTCSIYIQLAKEQDIAKELEKIFVNMEYGLSDV